MNKKWMIALLAVCIVAVVGMVIALAVTGKKGEAPQFTPPPFEAAAQTGMPTVENGHWEKIFQTGMSFVAYVCGEFSITDGAADVYFTNDEGNNAWLKLRIMDEEGNILAETGLLKPGQYVKTVQFTTLPTTGQKLTMKIMGYEPETYHSVGAVVLKPNII